ncbi:MAG: S41 family peptidase, partial [Bacteroidota bacterium]
MLRHLILSVITIVFCGCQALVLGDAEANNPVNNFELLWNDFDQHYGLFEARGWDWDSIYNVYQPQVTAETTNQELWTIFKEMVAYLDDSHTYVYWRGTEFFASGSERDELTEAEFNARLPFTAYGLDTMVVDREEEYYYGRFAGRDIGYFYLGSVEMEDPDAVMSGLLNRLRDRAALIIDLRNNTGGDDPVAAAIAGHFADARHFIYTVEERNGRAPGAFGP